VGYEAEATVIPDARTGHYEVRFRVMDSPAVGEPKVLSEPRLLVSEGQKGEIFIGDERSSVKCGATIERHDGGLTATTRVRIQEGHRRVWVSRQTMDLREGLPTTTVKPSAPAAGATDGEKR
jgi:type II secretory pathway component HofQ